MLRTFLEFLEEGQMMMFSTRPVEVYHASNTGKDNSVLQSFKTRGVLPKIAHGWGQGAGFYVWSSKDSAAEHANAIVSGSLEKTQARNDGLPMIVTIETILDPEVWNLDFEISKGPIVRWIYKNFDKLQPILSGEEYSLARKNPNFPSIAIAFGKKTSGIGAEGESNIGQGEKLGHIMNKLEEKDPQTVRRFEELNEALSKKWEELFFANLPPATAIKYVGKAPLKPKRIEVLKDGRWIEV